MSKSENINNEFFIEIAKKNDASFKVELVYFFDEPNFEQNVETFFEYVKKNGKDPEIQNKLIKRTLDFLIDKNHHLLLDTKIKKLPQDMAKVHSQTYLYDRITESQLAEIRFSRIINENLKMGSIYGEIQELDSNKDMVLKTLLYAQNNDIEDKEYIIKKSLYALLKDNSKENTDDKTLALDMLKNNNIVLDVDFLQELEKTVNSNEVNVLENSFNSTFLAQLFDKLPIELMSEIHSDKNKKFKKLSKDLDKHINKKLQIIDLASAKPEDLNFCIIPKYAELLLSSKGNKFNKIIVNALDDRIFINLASSSPDFVKEFSNKANAVFFLNENSHDNRVDMAIIINNSEFLKKEGGRNIAKDFLKKYIQYGHYWNIKESENNNELVPEFKQILEEVRNERDVKGIIEEEENKVIKILFDKVMEDKDFTESKKLTDRVITFDDYAKEFSKNTNLALSYLIGSVDKKIHNKKAFKKIVDNILDDILLDKEPFDPENIEKQAILSKIDAKKLFINYDLSKLEEIFANNDIYENSFGEKIKDKIFNQIMNDPTLFNEVSEKKYPKLTHNFKENIF